MLGVRESSGDKQLCVGKVAGSQGRGLGFPESFCRHLRAAELPSANENQKQGPGNLGWGGGGKKGNTCFGSSRPGLQEAGGKGPTVRRATTP